MKKNAAIFTHSNNTSRVNMALAQFKDVDTADESDIE